MKEIDRRGRILLRLIIVSIFGTLDSLFVVAILADPVTDPAEWRGLILIFVLFNIIFVCALIHACRSTPRVYFADEGVYMQPFFRKKLYHWDDIQQAVILERVIRTRHGREVIYQFFLLTKEGSAWHSGDTEKTYRRRNRKYLLLIPLTNESKEYVKLHHVKMAIDQSIGKRILWRGVK